MTTIRDIIKEHMPPDVRQEGGDHYKTMGVQPWEVVDTWPIEQQIGAHRLAALKYIMRLGSKDEMVQEAKKARHCMDKLIHVLERKERENGI